MKKKKCRLCNDELNSDNCCRSHIIPEFIWRDYMTNEKGQREEMIVLKKDNSPPRFLKKAGLVDDNILCRKCDDEILGRYENDFKEVWERVFKRGKLYPIETSSGIRGWVKEIGGAEDIIKTKLFILTCIWRASVSELDDYPIRLNRRREIALRRVLLGGGDNKLLHTYSMICTKFEDENYPLAIAPFYDRNNKKRLNLVRFYLPLGYLFIIRLGCEKIDEKMGAEEFGALKEAFFVGNMGKLEGSMSEKRLFLSALKGLQNMYPSDKKKLKNKMLEEHDDLSVEDIEKVLKM